MVKSTPIYFTDRTNSGNAFFKLEVGRSLLTFSEFDFTFFWETAIEAGRQAKRTGTLPKATMDSARASISKAHPFIYAGRDGDYSDIVIDCIIEYICRSERLSEDELWMRCISSKIPYEAAIFKRISEYKTFHAANEWAIVSGLQKYVKDKINFIYDGEHQTSLKCHTLKQYFDLAYSIASNECSIPKTALPSIRVYNPCLAPSAAFAVSSSAAKSIYKRLEEQLMNVPDLSGYDKYNTEVLEDKFASLAYSYCTGLTRPQEPEEELFVTALENLPEKVYVVSSLKALIDLEFDIMSETGVHLKRCENCDRYFLITATGFGEKYCDRINSTGLTCKALAEAKPKPLLNYPDTEDLLKTAQQYAPQPQQYSQPPVPPQQYAPQTQQYAQPTTPPVQQYSPPLEFPPSEYPPDELDSVPFTTNIPAKPTPTPVVDKTEYFPEIGDVHIKYSAPKREFAPAEIPDNLEKRCQSLYNSIYKRVDKSISEHEFREWSQYLSNMKRNVKTGEGNIEQLVKFLDYSDKLADEIKRAARQKRTISREPVARLARFAEATDNMHSIGNIPFPDYGLAPPPPPPVRDSDYSAYFSEERAPSFPSYSVPPQSQAAPPPRAEVMHKVPSESVQSFEAQNFAPQNFAEQNAAPETIAENRLLKAAGNVKLKDAEAVEIDGRKATLANPVWERVQRDE
ncbi:MAG: DUF6076 domain-containing protein [Ruminococcus sp.]|jgi:hypothetical protein|nr:DUF6076 domain-containing protein [Ruminococcus sp.]